DAECLRENAGADSRGRGSLSGLRRLRLLHPYRCQRYARLRTVVARAAVPHSRHTAQQIKLRIAHVEGKRDSSVCCAGRDIGIARVRWQEKKARQAQVRQAWSRRLK